MLRGPIATTLSLAGSPSQVETWFPSLEGSIEIGLIPILFRKLFSNSLTFTTQVRQVVIPLCKPQSRLFSWFCAVSGLSWEQLFSVLLCSDTAKAGKIKSLALFLLKLLSRQSPKAVSERKRLMIWLKKGQSTLMINIFDWIRYSWTVQELIWTGSKSILWKYLQSYPFKAIDWCTS